MKRNLKRMMYVVSAGILFQFGLGGGCAQFLGDLTADLLFLNQQGA